MILQASQRGITESTTPNINLRTDSGGTRFRHRLNQLIDAETISTRAADGGRSVVVSTTVSA